MKTITKPHIPQTSSSLAWIRFLKVHGNEADFLGFLQKVVPHESLTLPFGPFRFWLRNRGDIHLRKLIPGIVESESHTLPASLIRGVGDSPHQRYRESAIEFFKKKTLCIDDTESGRLPALVIRWVADSRIIESEYFKWLKHAFKGSLWPKISQGCIVLSQ